MRSTGRKRGWGLEFLMVRELNRGRGRKRKKFESDQAFHDEAPSLATVYNWFDEFKCGRINLTDDLGEGTTSTATSEDNISAVRLMIEINKRVTYQPTRFGQTYASV
ncbi:hypothetical protein EVAR_33604_1 [Eumeta japonica]|uniref:Histone-lysine N-methyltransferase SETMAR n=1 Tax=Eumeta variegata TaxID=151549 RepID=A0A4C1WCM4_EUMVA|nr:hypothetical protein EVAR_33604_1 [Eumeta japonica]